MSGNSHTKRNCWSRGNGPNSMRGELRGGIRLNKKRLNRKVRRNNKDIASGKSGYKRIEKTIQSVDFT